MTTFTTDDRLQAEKIDDIELTDAQDAFYTFDDEHNNMFDDDDRMLFVEAYNQGQQAMKDKILTLLGGFK